MTTANKLTRGVFTITLILLAGIHSPPRLFAQAEAEAVAVNCVPAPSGLVSWWQAEGNASDVMGTNNGNLVNGATFAPGEVGQALSLNGVNQYVSVPDSPSLRPTSLTIEAWVNFSAVTSARSIFMKPYGSGRLDSYALWFFEPGQLAGAITTVNGEGPWLTYAWTPVLGTWHHVAYTFDSGSSTQALYLDGAMVASGAVSGPIAYDTSPFQLGADIEYGVESYSFGGLIDEATLFSRALSASEIQGIYSAGSAGKCPPTAPGNCDPAPSGLISWWQAESNALDAVSGNNGTLVNGATFAPGKIGQAFSLNGVNQYVSVPDSPSLRPTNLTVEGWVNFSPASGSHVLFGKTYGSGAADSWLVWYDSTAGTLNASLDTTAGEGPWILANWGPGTGTWHHVAYSFDSGSHTQVLYADGVAVASSAVSGAMLFDTHPVLIGAEIESGVLSFFLNGLIDEVSLYNRALTGAEIAGIYSAGSSGKCQQAPSILTQPASQTVVAGSGVTFSVNAAGTSPLSYQWRFNGTNLDAATGSGLQLTNVQSANAGSYSVLVSNSIGTILSSNAVLTVNPPPPCTPPPAGLVSWWRGEGDASDALGVHGGTPSGGLSFASGEVGQAFSFNGVNAAVDLGNWFNLQSFSVALWVKAGASQVASADLIDNNHSASPWRSWSVEYGNTGLHFGWGFYCAGGGYTVVPFDLKTNTWQYLVLTLDSNRLAQVYLDGQLQGSATLTGAIIYDGTQFLRLGRWASGGRYFNGLMDEVDVYSRALAVAEVQGLYQSGSTGKCGPAYPPSILSQPASQTVFVGDSASFAASAAGTAPLSYQWQLNGTNVAGATGTSLTLSNVQPAQAGNYAMMVTNEFGSTVSSNALLTVNPPPPCASPPAGLVSWWQAEGNASDILGTNNGTLMNGATFAPGKVGQAFSLNGVNQYISVVDCPAVRPTNLTIEGWVNFSTLTGVARCLFEKPYGTSTADSFSVVYYAGQLIGAITTASGGGPWVSYTWTPGLGTWHHVAYTFNSATSTQVLYVDGVAVASGAVSGSIVYDTNPFLIGADIENGSPAYFFGGLIDEASLFNRALSASEIAAIYTAGASGKCIAAYPPVVTLQPADRTIVAGDNTSFTVAATGARPISYQWRLNGTNIDGATGSALVLAYARFADAGVYSAVLSNGAGTVLSSNALLTVNPLPPCSAPPSGLASWWQAEGNASDILGTNNGTLMNGATFAPGEVGQAFSLNGVNQYISVPDSPSLRPTDLTIEAWVNFSAITGARSIFMKPYGSGRLDSYALWYFEPGQLAGAITTVNGEGPWLTNSWTPVLGTWHHVAYTFDSASSTQALYLDGAMVASGGVSGPIAYDTHPFQFGADIEYGAESYFFGGLIDEGALFNRALNASEIAAIYATGRTGMCDDPPSIAGQPESQTVTENSTATFSVVAGGTPDLHYQWRFNGTNIPGATTASLTLDNVQLTNAGLYSVQVANLFGSMTSSNALLTVNLAPVVQVVDVITAAGSNCLADASINNGSFDPDGDPITLSQTPPGPYPLGTNLVTLTVADNRGGSNSASALVIVLDQTPPVLTCPASIVVTNAHNSATSMVTFSPSARDNCSGVGLPVCTPPSGSAFEIGVHTVNVTVSDAAGNTSQGSFTVTVLPGNVAPVPVIEVSPLAEFPGYTNLMVIAPDGTNATVYFDGSKSYDLDDTNFLYFWSEGTNQFSTSVVASNLLALGSHTITLRLDDTFPLGVSSASVTVEVISPEEALSMVVALAEDSDLAHNRLQPLLATLNAIAASFDRGNLTAAINQLEAFENKVIAQVAPGDPDVADALLQAAQQIIDSLSSGDGTPPVPAQVQSLDREADGKLRMKFTAKAARVYLVQASTNLKDWETIGVAHDNGDGTFDYEDPAAPTMANRFYRILSP